MPLVKIDIFAGKSPSYQKAILDGVHSALVEAFKIPESDRNQRIFQHDSDSFEVPASKSNDYTLIELTVYKGRSLEAKRKLYSCIARNLRNSPGIKDEDITVVIHEPSLDNWCKSGKPASEAGVDFKIDV